LEFDCDLSLFSEEALITVIKYWEYCLLVYFKQNKCCTFSQCKVEFVPFYTHLYSLLCTVRTVLNASFGLDIDLLSLCLLVWSRGRCSGKKRRRRRGETLLIPPFLPDTHRWVRERDSRRCSRSKKVRLRQQCHFSPIVSCVGIYDLCV